MNPFLRLLFVGLLACSAKAYGAGLLIGFSQVTLQSPFYVELKEGAEAAAKAGGDQLIFLDANGDVNKQNNDIQDLISRGVKILVLNPVNPQAVAPSIEAAKSAGIPVITVDRPVEKGAVAHVGRDNVKMGNLVGQAVLEYLKSKNISPASAKVIEIQGDAGGIVMANRRDGFHAAVKAAGVPIIEGPYSEYIRANAVTATQDLLQAHPDVKVVYAHNDDMALGALQVLKEAGRNDVAVAGIDGLSEALKIMQPDGQYIATALNDPRYLGDVTIQTARQVAAKKSVPAFIDAGTTLVTSANVSQFDLDALFASYRPKIFAETK
jgi:ribose transport system substrate-binding protein